MHLFEKERDISMLEGIDASLIEQVKRDNAEFCRLLEEHERMSSSWRHIMICGL